MKALNVILRLALGAVFVYAGVLKIINPQSFAHEIDQYNFLPHALLNPLAITLPWVETLAGLVVITGVWARGGALVLTGLSAVFLFAVSSVLARGLKIKCGCFGTVGESFVGPWNVALDAALLAVALWLVWRLKD